MSELEKRDRPDMSAMADIAQEAVISLVDSFRRPSFRAGFGASLLTTALLARAGLRPGLAIFTSLMVGAAVEKLYGMVEDVHAASLESSAGIRGMADAVKLMNGGSDAPGEV